MVCNVLLPVEVASARFSDFLLSDGTIVLVVLRPMLTVSFAFLTPSAVVRPMFVVSRPLLVV